MADKRMFSNSVLGSDKFLDMSPLAQCLYVQFSMSADDDGFVLAPNRIRRGIGASEGEQKELSDNDFIIVFEDVLVIRHWLVNNILKKDRYHPTTRTDEMKRLALDESGAYVLRSDAEKPLEPDRNQDGTGMETDSSLVDYTLLNRSVVKCEMEPEPEQTTTETTPQRNIPTRLEVDEENHKQGYNLTNRSIERFIKWNSERNWDEPWKEQLKGWYEMERTYPGKQSSTKPKGNAFTTFADQHNYKWDELANTLATTPPIDY